MDRMLETEADDEHSSLENDEDILHLMDGIAIISQSNQDKNCKSRKIQTIRHHKITKAERNLMNNYHDNYSPSNNLKQHHKLKSLERWKGAISKVKKMKDPWKNFDLNNILSEKVERHIFDSLSGLWLKPVECHVKMESKSFNRGAMRECFRLKKMSSLFNERDDWNRACNYVAKRYIEHVDDIIYYEDVKLQMDAKLWGQEYSRQPGVIKKVDICQMSVIKYIDRPGQPLYHLEHFIEGDYIKYNSNSGFVDDHCRNTPQAFSHFTFERSGHKLIVVDIQGVGDLYTDPQIHTFSKTDYGDGNLGPRGMALFFNSHICNSICEILGLKKFDLSTSEMASRLQGCKKINDCGTVAIYNSCKVKSIFEETDHFDTDKVLLSRLNYDKINDISTDESSLDNSNPLESNTIIYEAEDGDDEASVPVNKVRKYHRNRLRSSENIVNEDVYRQYFINKSMEHRASCVSNNFSIQCQIKNGECILGQIHHELARLHCCGKLVNGDKMDNIDWDSFMFHEETSAKLGYLEAMCNLSRFYLGLDPDSLFENYPFRPCAEDKEVGLQYMTMAADYGDRRSMIYLGDYFRKDADVLNWFESYKWYERAVLTANDNDNSGCFDSINDIPLYEIEARMAEIIAIGGHSIEQNLETAYDLYSQAANNAMTAGKGRCATKYYNIADEILLKINNE